MVDESRSAEFNSSKVPSGDWRKEKSGRRPAYWANNSSTQPSWAAACTAGSGRSVSEGESARLLTIKASLSRDERRNTVRGWAQGEVFGGSGLWIIVVAREGWVLRDFGGVFIVVSFFVSFSFFLTRPILGLIYL